MKKLFAILAAAFVLNVSVATVPVFEGGKPLKATEIMLPIGKSGQTISLAEFSRLKPDEYEKLANVKLGFFNRIAYKMAMKKLRKGIAADGTITNKKLVKMFAKGGDSDTGFHFGGFALGFFLGLIGLLIAYLAFSDENKSNRIKWAWIGWGIWVVILLAIILSAK